MPSSPPRERRARFRIIGALTLAAVAATTGCSSHAKSSAPTTSTTLITADAWSPPAVSGPPSTGTFCTLLVAAYKHIGTLPLAANLKVKQDIVRDYVGFEPRVVAQAPPSIKADANVYLGAVASTLAALNQVGLDASKLKPGQIGVDLLSPQVEAASTVVLSFSRSSCHYAIGG